MKDVLVALFLIAMVVVISFVIQHYTKCRKRNHKLGVIVIPVNNDTENVDFAVKSAYYEESFDNTPCGREILIVDFGCKPQVWEHYRVLASDFSTVHAISSHELYAYLKVKYS